jgi:hypothetical protein
MYNNRDRIFAALTTLCLCILVAVMLFTVKITAEPPEIPPMEEQEVFFADIEMPELKEIKAKPTQQIDNKPSSAPAADAGGTDAVNSGVSDAPPTLVSSTEAQAENIKVEKKADPEPPGPTKEEIEAEKRAAIAQRVGRFTENAKANNDNDASGGAAETGKAKAGNNTNADGLGIAGRNLSSRPKAVFTSHTSIANGWIKVYIEVESNGTVSTARYAGENSGNLGADLANLTQQAVQYAKGLKYSVDNTKPTQKGIITIKINTGR